MHRMYLEEVYVRKKDADRKCSEKRELYEDLKLHCLFGGSSDKSLRLARNIIMH